MGVHVGPDPVSHARQWVCTWVLTPCLTAFSECARDGHTSQEFFPQPTTCWSAAPGKAEKWAVVWRKAPPPPRASGHRERPHALVTDAKPAQPSEIVPETKANASYTALDQLSAKGWILPVIPACGRGG